MPTSERRRELDFGSLDEMLDDARCLLEGGYQRLRQWHLADVCRHLAIALCGSIDGIDFRPPWWMPLMRPVIRRSLFGKRRIPEGIKAPPVLTPASQSDDQHAEDKAALAELTQAVERFQAHTGPLQPSPVLGRLTHEQWREFHCIHAAHHLSFLLPRASAPARTPAPANA